VKDRRPIQAWLTGMRKTSRQICETVSREDWVITSRGEALLEDEKREGKKPDGRNMREPLTEPRRIGFLWVLWIAFVGASIREMRTQESKRERNPIRAVPATKR